MIKGEKTCREEKYSSHARELVIRIHKNQVRLRLGVLEDGTLPAVRLRVRLEILDWFRLVLGRLFSESESDEIIKRPFFLVLLDLDFGDFLISMTGRFS